MGKCRRGQSGGGNTLYRSGVIQHIGDDNDSRNEAHDDSIPENGSHGNIGLMSRVIDAGSSGGNGGSADAGLVGKKPSGNAVAKRHLYGGAGKAARDGRKGKSILYDQKASCWKLFMIKAEQQKAAE